MTSRRWACFGALAISLFASAPAQAEDGGAPGETCVGGFEVCLDHVTPCCRDLFYCSGGKDDSVCVALRQKCESGDDCVSGQCIKGICKCQNSDQCKDKNRCDVATGQCLPACSDVIPCGEHEVCVPPGVCVPGCSSDEDCVDSAAGRTCILEYVDRDGDGDQPALWIGRCEPVAAEVNSSPRFQCAMDDGGQNVGGALVWLVLAGSAFLRAGTRRRSGG